MQPDGAHGNSRAGDQHPRRGVVRLGELIQNSTSKPTSR